MKIAFTHKKTATPVVLTEKGATRFVSDSGVERLEIPLGTPAKDMTRRKLVILARKVVRTANQHNLERIALSLEDFRFSNDAALADKELASLLAESFSMANFEFTTFKTVKASGGKLQEVCITGAVSPAAKQGFRQGLIIAEEVNKCRVLANTPGGDMTPSLLATAAKRAVRGTDVRVRVLDKKQIERERMGALLGVAKGSKEAPRFIILEYWGAGKDAKKPPVALVGKGVTFDTGGINLKPSEGIFDMYMDMSGGAAVIHAVVLAARLKLKRNIVALIPAVENMPSGESFRPGDILKSRSGKTIEVANTDAEGRLILADALDYAKTYKPKAIIDVATLTGAALAALGQHAVAVQANDDSLCDLLVEAGERSGDYAWPLPLWDEFDEYTKGNFADVANLPLNWNQRYAGAVMGGTFLKQFVDASTPWAHIDMSPRMTAHAHEYLAKGAVGSPVRLLLTAINEL